MSKVFSQDHTVNAICVTFFYTAMRRKTVSKDSIVCLLKGSFPDSLKLANITPVHKKDEPTDKENYRPVSVLPLLSKIFERLIYDQLNEYLDQYLNSLLCGFRKAHSTQHALFRLLQEWQNELDKSGFVGTILMDLSKAYDCLPHDLLIAKFEAYDIGKSGLNLLLNYL